MEAMTTAFLLALLALALVTLKWRRERRSFRQQLDSRDAAERKEQRGRAAESHRRLLLEAVLQDLNVGIVIADKSLKLVYGNRRLTALFAGARVVEGRALIEIVRNHEVESLAREALEKGVPRTSRLRLPEAQERILEVEAAPLPAATGGGVWVVIADVTERVQTEQIRRDFVANASHELRTPLTLINGYIETLRDGFVDDPLAARRCLEVMDKHGKRILRIVEDMLTISRLEGDTARLNKEPFDVKACVEGVLDQLTPLVEQRQPHIDLRFPAQGGVLEGDRFYWDQIFTNLIENALKENARPGLKLTVSGEWRTGQCVLKVSDNGIGIPVHDVPFVFKRFFRGAKHHSQGEVKGTGLGLSIVRRAVEAHGGTIELQSTPGVETAFTIRIPIRS
jgi:two-component system, OmpR family, phosphate regulon sensor histidine kinase PhoR